MTKEQTAQILSTLKAAFPAAYKGMGPADFAPLTNLWQEMFSQESYQEVMVAVKSLIRNREYGWTPSVGEVMAELNKGRKANLPNEEDAWLMVRKAARNGTYHSDREWAKLTPEIQAVLGGPWQIKEYASFSDSDMDRAANSFKKAYKVELERAVERQNGSPLDMQRLSDRLKF